MNNKQRINGGSQIKSQKFFFFQKVSYDSLSHPLSSYSRRRKPEHVQGLLGRQYLMSRIRSHIYVLLALKKAILDPEEC